MYHRTVRQFNNSQNTCIDDMNMNIYLSFCILNRQAHSHKCHCHHCLETYLASLLAFLKSGNFLKKKLLFLPSGITPIGNPSFFYMYINKQHAYIHYSERTCESTKGLYISPLEFYSANTE